MLVSLRGLIRAHGGAIKQTYGAPVGVRGSRPSARRAKRRAFGSTDA
jgi:hypothetical protein